MMNFFSQSDFLDRMALRPLSHIRSNWEIMWDFKTKQYKPEEDSFAELLNGLIGEMDTVDPPRKYHDNEDRLAEYVRDRLGWSVRKVGSRWIGADYQSILEQGGFDDIDERNLVMAAVGRIKAARRRGQQHFDDMEESHQKILAAVIAIIMYHRMNHDI